MLALVTIVFIIVLSHFTYQYFRRKKNFKDNRTFLTVTKKLDLEYWVNSITIILFSILTGLNLSRLQFEYYNYMIPLIFVCITIVFLMASFKPFMICETGIFFPNRFVKWQDIVDYEWEGVNKKSEKLVVTSKRRPPLFIMIDYDLKINIPIANKAFIEDILKNREKQFGNYLSF